jgi:leucine-zipper-like transcriptional regulator 1
VLRNRSFQQLHLSADSIELKETPVAMDEMRWSEPPQSEEGQPTIKNHSVTHFNGNLYCFGGYDGRRNHQTLLLYNIANQQWLQTTDSSEARPRGEVKVEGTPPPGRNGHTATLVTDPDDDEHGRIIIIGGWLGQGPLAASDMHVLDVSSSGLRWYQPTVKGTTPGPCNMHSADFVPARREVYVFRGGNGREYLNDLHALHVDAYQWRKVETTGQLPQQRANHSSAYLDETAELFIFGGW